MTGGARCFQGRLTAWLFVACLKDTGGQVAKEQGDGEGSRGGGVFDCWKAFLPDTREHATNGSDSLLRLRAHYQPDP